MRFSRPLKVVLYAAFIGVLLASYVTPLQQILERRAEIPVLQEKIQETNAYNAEQRRLAESLNTPEGIERAAREDYGMIRPGEKIYIISEARERP
ncbi:MAG TPA: septum formation initiator family protein [Rubrobacteraceae bacterium]|nr:septum formation initiator family protein [Rubrobacteraceae bacterium]